MSLFKELQQELETYLPREQIEIVAAAYELAASAHKGQRRHSGEPYVTHPVAVTLVLAKMRLDQSSLCAALLHDVIEDTHIEKETLIEKFGDEVATIVDGVSKLTQIEFESREEAQAENFRKMVLAMAHDIRVIIVKLADRLHNMRTLHACSPSKRRRIARETLDIYSPIANRLGMHNFMVEFEELGFEAIYPRRYRVLKKAVRDIRGNRKEMLTDIESALKEALVHHGLSSDAVWGREKHLYSIYKKMKRKKLSFSEIMDVYAFRIIVDNRDNCYRALGVIHNLYKPVPERFKDYIAIPKANGYQALHTTLFGPYGVPIEIQIRTHEMDNLANVGIAAHWLYKSESVAITDAQVRAQAWLQGLLEIQKNAGDPIEFIENVKIDLFPDEVYVFTPKGHIMELPRGATPVDFAYAVHSEVGNHCVAAKIDKRLAPLSTLLVNGARVEIITAPGARPNPAWLNFVVTGKARGSIRHFLKSQRTTESIAFGKRLLDRALAAKNLAWEKIPDITIQRMLKQHRLTKIDELFEAIGLGKKMAPLMAAQLAADLEASDDQNVEDHNVKSEPLPIMGSEGMMVRFASCCHPIPGDPIVGVMEVGRGITIHTDDCETVAGYHHDSQHIVALRWDDDVGGEFRVDVRLLVENKRGVFASIALAIAEADSNIDDVSLDEHDGMYNIISITLSVSGRAHLARIMRRLRRIKPVVRLLRNKGEFDPSKLI